MRGRSLPVDPERLRRQFPDLTEDDLEAYVTVTRQVLTDPAERGRVLKDTLTRAAEAEDKAASGAPLTPEESLAFRYRRAVDKMQSSTSRRP